MSDFFRIHLYGSGHSGRGVQYRVLDPDQVDKVEKLASGDLDKDANVYDLNSAVAKNALQAMVVAITEPCKPHEFRGVAEKKGGAVPAVLTWRNVTPEELDDKWARLFTARDTVMLRRVYQKEHVVSDDEVKDVLEGKVPVTSDE